LDSYPDFRVYDEDGTCIMYRKCSRDTGVLEYVNFFCMASGKRRKWRRDTYSTAGILSRMQYIDPASGESLFEHYLRPDGSVAIIQLYQLKNGERELWKISLMNRSGVCIAEYSSLEGLIEHWLREVTSDQNCHFVMVSDKNRYYYRPLCRVKESESGANVSVVAMIHAVHTKDGFKVQTSGTNSNYADILSDPAVPDAIVVGTEKQKQDIIERYGPGNLALPVSRGCVYPTSVL
jgi:poly(glycerol-phosphate) alpha-glucosyltransferase